MNNLKNVKDILEAIEAVENRAKEALEAGDPVPHTSAETTSSRFRSV
jgi:hypothetical protein